MKALSQHMVRGGSTLSERTAIAVKGIQASLAADIPRAVTAPSASVYHIYVDASFEPDGRSGIGGLIMNEKGRAMSFFSELLPPSFLAMVINID